jgi:hypothetical protein
LKCNKLLDSTNMVDKGFDVYCRPCYSKDFGPKVGLPVLFFSLGCVSRFCLTLVILRAMAMEDYYRLKALPDRIMLHYIK